MPKNRYVLSQSSEFCGHKPPLLLLCVLSAILDFITDGLKEQRTCIIHHFKLGERHRKRMEIAKKKFSAAMPYEEQTLEWFSRYNRGETFVADFEYSERPSTGSIAKNMAKVRKIDKEDRRSSIRRCMAG